MNATLASIETEAAMAQQIRQAKAAASAMLGAQTHLGFSEVAAHSNFNYLYRCTHAGRQYFLKVTGGAPKAIDGALPKERALSEARAMQMCGRLVEGDIDVPQVIGIDAASCSFLMSDVERAGSRNLADVIRDDYALYLRSIGPMAKAVGRFHRGSGKRADCHDLPQTAELRKFAYDVLLRRGIRGLAGERGDDVLRWMEDSRECLIHSDLWAKNMLVSACGRMALIDFEGAMLGDPAFDLATLIAAAVIPCYQGSARPDQCEASYLRILAAYEDGLDDADWARRIIGRTGQALAVMLAARAAGPFPYEMAVRERSLLGRLAIDLLDTASIDGGGLLRVISNHARNAALR